MVKVIARMVEIVWITFLLAMFCAALIAAFQPQMFFLLLDKIL
jgi:hypothetical protein